MSVLEKTSAVVSHQLKRERMTCRMSKHFAMLNAARRLENHLSRENYNLNRMAENERISLSLFKKKVDHHNELVDALNDLFASLADSPSSKLFNRYVIHDPETELLTIEEEPEVSFIPEVTEDEEETVTDEQPPFDERVTTIAEPEPESKEADDPDEPVWQSEGYDSYEAWLADKDTESVQYSDDLSLSVNDVMSRYRAEQALSEYSETSERDIASYLPEEEVPANVLPHEGEQTYEEDEDQNEAADGEFSATNYNYLDHTVDNVRVDNDPTQIAGVETAVERYGENARQGTDIDVSTFLYQSEPAVVDDLIRDDIEQLHAPQEAETVNEG
ncbi:hypothetical protein [Evansella clarkii]|uniref:hypothetical protein n=1 Tax=Evansella clarkii TaxID=79879 RepID=UPI001C442FDF|nr:hypothetical protein [Evansella clarkii]